MNKKWYIIPGWQETCRRRQYRELGNVLKNQGLDVVYVHVDWTKKLSQQIFEIEADSVLFGFSMGAILARLVAQKHPCALVIFASMTPLRHFQGGKQEKLLADVIGNKLVIDIKNNLTTKLQSKSLVLYGDKEDEKADIIIKNTDHEITQNYIQQVLHIAQNTLAR